MARTPPPPDQDRRGLTDDYLIEDGQGAVPVVLRLLQGLRFVLVAVLAAVSLALFWLVGTMIGLF